MTYLIGQSLGLLATLSCLALPMFRKKWQMLLCNAFGNALFAANLLLIGQPRSLLVYGVAIVQSLIMLWHNRSHTTVARRENLIFLFLYVFCGALGYQYLVDLLPIAGAVFNMLATFQPDEQKTRYLLLFNSATFGIYYFLIGSTALLSAMITVISTIVAILRYRKR